MRRLEKLEVQPSPGSTELTDLSCNSTGRIWTRGRWGEGTDCFTDTFVYEVGSWLSHPVYLRRVLAT